MPPPCLPGCARDAGGGHSRLLLPFRTPIREADARFAAREKTGIADAPPRRHRSRRRDLPRSYPRPHPRIKRELEGKSANEYGQMIAKKSSISASFGTYTDECEQITGG